MSSDTTAKTGTASRPTQSQDHTHNTKTTLATSPGSLQEEPVANLEADVTRRALHLLVILCLGSLASFSLAPSFLQQKPEVNTISSYSTCPSLPITHGQSTERSMTPVPPAWTSAGKNSQQFALAQVCAALFTVTYESIDIKDPLSLTSAVYLLSASSKKRFFEGTGTEPKDVHMDATWQAQARKEHLQQSAKVTRQAQLQAVHIGQHTFSASFLVQYELTTRASGKVTTQQKQLIIVLEEVHITSPGTATTWQIADWYKPKA